MKSPAGVPSKTQRQVCKELRAAGADWYLVRSAAVAVLQDEALETRRHDLDAEAAQLLIPGDRIRTLDPNL